MTLEFRDLKANEIEARVATVTEKGVSLLLYKNTRCDMNILDETVGATRWQRDHKELKGNIYCGIGIFNDVLGQWIWKWDCGSESYTEKEKGEASDSFKRAGFNWGIGRELYTAPFIWIKSDKCKIEQNSNGKPICKDRFRVSKVEIEDGTITALIIVSSKGEVVFQMGYETSKSEYPKVICPDCGAQIFRTKVNGIPFMPQDILEKFGGCINCYKQKKRNEKAV